jgi:hypothetical protein
MNRPTTAATRLRSHLASIYGDRAGAARLREQADTLDRLRAAGDEGDRLLHESALLAAKINLRRASRARAKRFRAQIIAAAVRADRDSR